MRYLAASIANALQSPLSCIVGASETMVDTVIRERAAAPADFGEQDYPSALVNVTNACNLRCTHCFVFRDENPNEPRDKMDDATMLAHLAELRDKHHIKSMFFMGGEPMIRRKLVLNAVDLFERSTIVTNGTYGIPSVPGHVVSLSLDGPEQLNDPIRGDGVFAKVKDAVFTRKMGDGTTVIIQMVITRQNESGIEGFVEQVKTWPINGLAFTLYVPTRDDDSGLDWPDLADRDRVVDRVIALKRLHPTLIKANIAALEMMKSGVALDYTGREGENCALLGSALPLYMGDGGTFERTFCCYGNDVDCSRCGSYLVFNAAYHISEGHGANHWGS